ncbi:hypothetical protein ACA910_021524 [Epithemia clementina (nom. ined.)]
MDSSESNKNSPSLRGYSASASIGSSRQSDRRNTFRKFHHGEGEISPSAKAVIEEELEREENLHTDDLAHLVATPEIKPVMDSLLERDYDTEPTDLYSALQKKRWSEAITILEQAPEEARTWVYRKEPQKLKIRWRLLPIHGAIIFQAPPEVVESILLIFPEGAAERDDEGSLPIHLAYKRASGASVCKLLLDAFPNSIDIPDRKGRTPKHLAASSSGPKHREFVYAMKNHLLALRAARVAARAEERLKYNAKLEVFKKDHSDEIATIEKKKASEIAVLEKKIVELEGELRRTQAASKVLVDHVASIEEKLAHQEELEKKLKNSVETLENDLDENMKSRNDEEQKLKQEISDLNKQLASIQQHVNNLLVEKDVLNKSLDEVVAGAELEKKALEESNAEKDDEISRLLREADKTREETAKLRTEIEERIVTEASLSKQINELQTQLRNQTDSASKAAQKAKARLEELEKDRLDLRKTVGALTQKLQTVAGFLEDMSSEQEAIIEQADVHEAEMQAASKEHARILDQVSKQQELDAKAQESREAIMKMIRYHEEAYLRDTVSRTHIVEAVDLQTKHLSDGAARREKLVNNVKALQEKIQSTRARVLGGLPELEARAKEFSPRNQEAQRAIEMFSDYKEDREQQHHQQHVGESRPQEESRDNKSNNFAERNVEVREEIREAAATVGAVLHQHKSPQHHKESKQTPTRRRQPPFEDEKKTGERVDSNAEDEVHVYSAFV